MLALVRKLLIDKLWVNFKESQSHYPHLLQNQQVILDHLAIIDIPSVHSGIPTLKKIFTILGFKEQGSGYLEDKVNDFIWMMPEDNQHQMAINSLPQVVLADFRLNLLSPKAREILKKYTANIVPFDFNVFTQYVNELKEGKIDNSEQVVNLVYNYINRTPPIMPTLNEYQYIKNENQLIAWVMLFGRKVNHFGICTHLLKGVPTLGYCNDQVTKEGVELNAQGGEIKGSKQVGIEQSSTYGAKLTVKLADANVEVQGSFLEFVWRHSGKQNPILWSDYFTGFVAYNANTVIESLYDLAS